MSNENDKVLTAASPVIPRLFLLGARPNLMKEPTVGMPRGLVGVPTTPITPCTPGTPGSCPSTPGSACSDRSSIGGYSWDPAMTSLPVKCRNTSGLLFKYKFGSGGRGKCIKVGDCWYTPREFETLGGRGGSKDWKRSIKCGGGSIQYLIEEGHLQPHATTCTCPVCCDEDSLAGPVRLFVPYKRRKGNTLTPELDGISKGGNKLIHSDSSSRSPPSSPLNNNKDECDGRTSPSSNFDNDLDNLWAELEERVTSWIKYGQSLKRMIDRVKQTSALAREAALQQLKEQLEAEKKEAIEAVSLPDDSTNAVDSDKKCANCNREARIVCTGCTHVNYCSEFCQNRDWNQHKEECQVQEDKKPKETTTVSIVIEDTTTTTTPPTIVETQN